MKLDLHGPYKSDSTGKADLTDSHELAQQTDCNAVVTMYRYNLAKQLGIVTLGLEKDGFTLEPSLKYDVEKQQPHPVLAISQKKGQDTLKAMYDIDGETGTLEWIRKPYKVSPHCRL